MLFGFCNTLATFQQLIEKVLAGMARDSCLVYLDDMRIVDTSFTKHLKNLRQVCEQLQEAGLCLKPQKCHLVEDKVWTTLTSL